MFPVCVDDARAMRREFLIGLTPLQLSFGLFNPRTPVNDFMELPTCGVPGDQAKVRFGIHKF